MAQPVIVPRESEEMEVCRILTWHVRRGDRVQAGDLLCEVDTGKATFDLEAPVEGTVLDIFYEEDDEAPLLTPIAVLGEEGEEYGSLRPDASVPDESAAPGVEGQKKPDASVPERGPREKQQTAPGDPEGGGTLASPRARRLAARQGIPLNRVRGSGPGGAVVERDIRRWLQHLGTES
jgi:pyruvate dehydrogenase E2 component (dihydrolipoamide acetyltransferase)